MKKTNTKINILSGYWILFDKCLSCRTWMSTFMVVAAGQMWSVRIVMAAGICQAEHPLSDGALLRLLCGENEWKENFSKDIIMCLIILFPVRLIFPWSSPTTTDLLTPEMKFGHLASHEEKGKWPRVGIWLWQDFGHSLLFNWRFEKNLVWERMCLCVCEFEPYLKCENASGINVRLQYVWRELRGNLHPRVLLYAPHVEPTAGDDYLRVLT